jgi:hypothetical protein
LEADWELIETLPRMPPSADRRRVERILSTFGSHVVMEPVVAYFSMEIGLESDMPIYAGGLVPFQATCCARVPALRVMQHAVVLNGSYFSTQRRVQLYVTKAYFG